MFSLKYMPLLAVSDTSSDIELMEPVINGVVCTVDSWIQDSVASLISMFASEYSATDKALYELIGINSAEPWNNSLFNVFYWVGILLLTGLFIYSMWIISMGPRASQKNDIGDLIFRFFGTLIGIFSIRWFLSLLNGAENSLHDRMNLNIQSSLDSLELIGEIKVFDRIFAATPAGISVTMVLMIIRIFFLVAILIEFIKFAMEIVERYLVTHLLLISSPSAISLCISRTTSPVVGGFTHGKQ